MKTTALQICDFRLILWTKMRKTMQFLCFNCIAFVIFRCYTVLVVSTLWHYKSVSFLNCLTDIGCVSVYLFAGFCFSVCLCLYLSVFLLVHREKCWWSGWWQWTVSSCQWTTSAKLRHTCISHTTSASVLHYCIVFMWFHILLTKCAIISICFRFSSMGLSGCILYNNFSNWPTISC